MSEEEKKPSTLAKVKETLKNLPGASLLFAIGPLMVLGYLGWYYYGAEHLDRALYSLKQENIKVVSPAPPWIKADVVDEVYRTAGLDRISLLDVTATATVAQAFETHVWVKSVPNVRKGANGALQVDLIFRRPVAMVYYKGPVQDGNGVKEIKGFYPVDSEGIVLPGEDFLPDPDEDASESEYNKYFQIFAGKNGVPPASSIGMPFGDPRITEAISLCIYLEKLRDQLGIKELEIAQEQFSLGPSPYLHVLLTGESPPRKIIWGHAPDKEVSGEPKPEDKKQRLISWLSDSEQSEGQLTLDLRSSSSIIPVSNSRY